MIRHDQLFKELLQTFLRQFLQAFAPELCRGLKLAQVELLDKELIWGRGGQRRTKLVDLVARVRLARQEGFVVVHVEHQSRRERDIGRRLFVYAAWLVQRYNLPVYPILLTSYQQPRRAEPQRYRMEVSGFRVLDFQFRVVQLNRLRWQDYAGLSNPAAVALMSRMRIAPRDRVKVALQMMRLMSTLRLEEQQMELIAAFMEQYLALSAKEELAFCGALDNLSDSTSKRKIMKLMTRWERRGRQEGRQEGRQQGRQEGQLVTIKRQLRALFGPLTPAQEQRLGQLGESRLSELAEALLRFSSGADLDRWLARQVQNGGNQ